MSPARGRRIVAMGGGGFTMGERSPALDHLVLALTGKAVPRICFLPTASGDPREQVTRFHERFRDWPCDPSTLSLFHLSRDRLDPIEHLLSQDAIYVGGGSMRNLLAIWHEHGVDQAMRDAWAMGIVLAGLSAGAMCWFEGGVSMSGGAPAPSAGLGLLDGSMSVHLSSEPERLPVYREAVGHGALAPGYAVDDGAALVFAGDELCECVVSHQGARALRVSAGQDGETIEEELAVRLLHGSTLGPSADPAGTAEIAEFRSLRAGRNRWE